MLKILFDWCMFQKEIRFLILYVILKNPKTYNYTKQRLISRFSEVTNEIKSDKALVTRETNNKNRKPDLTEFEVYL